MLKAFETIEDFETINIASSIPVTIKEVLNIILKINENLSANLKFDTSMPTMLPKRLINTDKIRKSVTESQISLAEGLALTINWYKDYYKDASPRINMIISRTPFRISFFGGGTDYPEWFEKYKELLLALALTNTAI